MRMSFSELCLIDNSFVLFGGILGNLNVILYPAAAIRKMFTATGSADQFHGYESGEDD